MRPEVSIEIRGTPHIAGDEGFGAKITLLRTALRGKPFARSAVIHPPAESPERPREMTAKLEGVGVAEIVPVDGVAEFLDLAAARRICPPFPEAPARADDAQVAGGGNL